MPLNKETKTDHQLSKCLLNIIFRNRWANIDRDETACIMQIKI